MVLLGDPTDITLVPDVQDETAPAVGHDGTGVPVATRSRQAVRVMHRGHVR